MWPTKLIYHDTIGMSFWYLHLSTFPDADNLPSTFLSPEKYSLPLHEALQTPLRSPPWYAAAVISYVCSRFSISHQMGWLTLPFPLWIVIRIFFAFESTFHLAETSASNCFQPSTNESIFFWMFPFPGVTHSSVLHWYPWLSVPQLYWSFPVDMQAKWFL